ncbi:MAG: ribbon-helix-helix protein, CopG family [Candidatus Altiarchaeales archaeon]|nr:ribbon-helix-helix protein, CopG family [Candidatus Altiarchaeales archaeon]
MKLVNIKLSEDLLTQVDEIYTQFGFSNRTEFIRNALREKVEEYKLKQDIKKLRKAYGIFKHKQTTEEEYEKMREEGFKKFAARFNKPPLD